MNRTDRSRPWTPALLALGMLALAVPALAAGESPSPDPADPQKEAAGLVMATVDGEPITLLDLQEGFGARHMGHGSLLAGKSILRDVLDKAIDERLLIQEGYRMGIQDEPEVQEAVKAFRDVQLLEAMERREFHDAAEPTQEEVQEVYGQLKTQRRLFLIETSRRDEAEEARRRLDAGEEFDEVARELSIHRTRNRGGDLGWVTWGRLSPQVEKEVFAAEAGRTLGPMAADGVYQIVRITEIREAEPPELHRVADRLRELLRQRKRDAIFSEFFNRIQEKHPPRENKEALKGLLLGGAPEEGGEAEVPDDTVLLTTETGLELTAGKVRERASSADLSLAEAWRKAAVDALLIDEARRRVKPDAEMEKRVHAYLQSLIRQRVQGLALSAMPEIKEKEIKAAWEEDRAAFKRPDSYHLRHILVATREEAEEIRKLLEEGGDFAELAAARSLDGESAAAGGDLGWMNAPVGGEKTGVLALDPGEISGVIPMKEGFAVVQVLEVKEGVMPGYEDVKGQVARKVLSARQREVLDAFLERLRENAEITRRPEAVERGAVLLDAIAERRLTPSAQGGKPGGHP